MAGIASILHRETIAVLVGQKTFERGEDCFGAGRVIVVEAIENELRGKVKPAEVGRRDYVVRMWLRAEGVAYECTCPVGRARQFCKHAVAISLAHLAREREEIARGIGVLKQALATIDGPALHDALLRQARTDVDFATGLKRVCLDALAQPPRPVT
jgi:uncharacterized Zn finger protein